MNGSRSVRTSTNGSTRRTCLPGIVSSSTSATLSRTTSPRSAAETAINASGLRAFVWLAGDKELNALDWQHPAYRYSPALQSLTDAAAAVPVFPNGDYSAHMTQDPRWGTFGHPWQQTLTIWGVDLIESLGAGLLTWLPASRKRVASVGPRPVYEGSATFVHVVAPPVGERVDGEPPEVWPAVETFFRGARV